MTIKNTLKKYDVVFATKKVKRNKKGAIQSLTIKSKYKNPTVNYKYYLNTNFNENSNPIVLSFNKKTKELTLKELVPEVSVCGELQPAPPSPPTPPTTSKKDKEVKVIIMKTTDEGGSSKKDLEMNVDVEVDEDNGKIIIKKMIDGKEEIEEIDYDFANKNGDKKEIQIKKIILDKDEEINKDANGKKITKKIIKINRNGKTTTTVKTIIEEEEKVFEENETDD